MTSKWFMIIHTRFVENKNAFRTLRGDCQIHPNCRLTKAQNNLYQQPILYCAVFQHIWLHRNFIKIMFIFLNHSFYVSQPFWPPSWRGGASRSFFFVLGLVSLVAFWLTVKAQIQTLNIHILSIQYAWWSSKLFFSI